jgi:hypothetical protein
MFMKLKSVQLLALLSITPTCGLYYKHITIVNDTSRVVSKWCSKLWYHLWSWLMTWAKAKVRANKTFIVQASFTIITYDHQNIFIVEATVRVKPIIFFTVLLFAPSSAYNRWIRTLKLRILSILVYHYASPTGFILLYVWRIGHRVISWIVRQLITRRPGTNVIKLLNSECV